MVMAIASVTSRVRAALAASSPLLLSAVLLLLAAAEAKPLKDSQFDDLLLWPKRSGNEGAAYDDDGTAAVTAAASEDGGVSMFFENADEFATTKIIPSGHSMTLECIVTTSGASATIHWLHNGRRVVQDPSELSVVNEAAAFEPDAADNAENSGPDVKTVSRLHIACVDRSKSGKYTCVADAPTMRRAISRRVAVVADAGEAAGSDRQCRSVEHASSSSPASAAVRIYMYKKSHDDSGGRTAQLFCRAAGSPRPRVQWYYAGGPRRVRLESGGKYELLNNGDLLIKNLETDDFGDYVCEASNGLSRSSITTNVYVYA